ncbi:hypothetical protein ACFFHP_15100 [Glutamicibacter ardleyensis]
MLVSTTWQTAFRIQGTGFPPISAPLRDSGSSRMSWNRFDIPGETVYFADKALCAYQEVLAQFKRKLGVADPLAKDADALGLSLEEFYDAVASEWEEKHFMSSGTLPRKWREDRQLHIVSMPQHGWWVHIEDPESICALERAIPDVLLDSGISALDTADLRSQNRLLTTSVAEHLASTKLFDGSLPLGIIFSSRHGSGINYAVWKQASKGPLMNRTDEMEVLASKPISFRDPDLETAARLFGLTVF